MAGFKQWLVKAPDHPDTHVTRAITRRHLPAELAEREDAERDRDERRAEEDGEPANVVYYITLYYIALYYIKLYWRRVQRSGGVTRGRGAPHRQDYITLHWGARCIILHYIGGAAHHRQDLISRGGLRRLHSPTVIRRAVRRGEGKGTTNATAGETCAIY